jgi:hypothetical protein
MPQAPAKKATFTFDTFILSLPSVAEFSEVLEERNNHNVTET